MIQQFHFIEKVRQPSVPMRHVYDLVMNVITNKLGKSAEEDKKYLLQELDLLQQVYSEL